MAIKELKCHEIRNLKNTHLKFNSKLNIITGDNGSGKTSLLESIYILATSKSFRTKQIKNCINHQASHFTLFGLFTNHSAGVQKDPIKLTTKINNRIIHKSSELAKLQSILCIDSSSFELITGGKQKRREFLDWALFHVKPSFAQSWLNYKNTLSQRNKLLREKKLGDIKYWDNFLIKFNDEIDTQRNIAFTEINALFVDVYSKNKNYKNLRINYKQGWKSGLTFKEDLDRKLSHDIKRGFTSVGTHKSDISFSIDNKELKEVLSRGQLKILIIHLNLILLRYVREKSTIMPIFIIDDLVAELDNKTVKDVIVSLIKKDHQIFISNIDFDESLREISISKTVFHVEHGEIKEI